MGRVVGRLRRDPAAPMSDTDEKGRELVTPVVELIPCLWCNAATPVRAKGRRPKFCSPECRLARHRAQQRVDRAYAELLDAEEALKRGATANE